MRRDPPRGRRIVRCDPKDKASKIRYRTRKDAKLAANYRWPDQRERPPQDPPLYVYKCPKCRGYHLTKQRQEC